MDSSFRERIVAQDKARVWHPYTEMSRYRDEVDPLVVVRAEGSRLYDADGSCYLDGNASWWTSTTDPSLSRYRTLEKASTSNGVPRREEDSAYWACKSAQPCWELA